MTEASPAEWSAHADLAFSRLADPHADRAQYLLRHGTMRVGIYAPREDDQEPHAQDEVYIVLRGSARFTRDGEDRPVKAGHVLLVPAGMPHRFEAVSEDFSTWVVFWGPDGGETDR